jgi:heat shock protein HslJ
MTAPAMLHEESSMMKTRTLLGSLVAGALLATLSVPAFAQEDQPIPIEGAEGITWQLAEQVVDGTMVAIPDEVVVTLLLQDGQAGGSAGCNSYFADYTIGISDLTFGPIGATMMFCEGAPGEVEAAYLANLSAVATWANTGGSLVLGDAEGDPILNYLPAPEGPEPTVEGVTWLLTSQVVDGTLAPLPAADGTPVLVSLHLADGRATGSGGCNRYFADYTLDGASLSFGTIGSTMMFCEGPAGEVETAYFANLASVASWSSDGAMLSLADAAGSTVLEYVLAPEASIVGGWVASAINNGNDAVVTSETTSQVTAVFAEDSSLTGFDGCNEYFTTYTLDGDAIRIDPQIGTTRMACATDALGEQSQQYYQALQAAATWAVTPDGTLELRDASGALQVSFLPAVG